MPAWPTEDLTRRLDRALGIARRTVTLLGEQGYRDDTTPQDSFGPDKPLAETAMLLHVASSVAQSVGLSDPVAALARQVAQFARSGRVTCAIALHPSICFQLAMPHILMSGLGRRDEAVDRLVSLSAASQAACGREVVPHRALEVLWLQSLWQGVTPGPAFDDVARHSVLDHPPDLIWGAREDAYAHTHTFMYFTNFGYWPRPLPRPRAVLLQESAALLARALLLEDFDLAAEALMAWPMTGESWSPVAAFGFQVLADLEDRVGFLPAGNGIPERFEHLAGPERTRYALAATYHTAYVMGMLCALALRPGRAPPAAIDGPGVSMGLLDRLLATIPVTDTPWQVRFSRLSPTERQALAPLVLDIALLHACRQHDYATVGQLLDSALQQGLANAPCCAQAAELLHRVSVCARACSEEG